MNKRILRIVIPVVTIAVLLIGAVAHFGSGAGVGTVKASNGATSGMTQMQKRLLDGLVSSELNPPQKTADPAKSNYFPSHADDQCALRLDSNIKVNQNCLNLTDPNLQGRGQAQNETAIAQDPNNPDHIVAGYNDYRRGDATCGVSYSLNGGHIWNDTTIPMGFTRGTNFGNVARQYWQAGGDTAVAWDTRGNVYFQCMVFMRGPVVTNNPDASSAIYIFRSTQNSGASWNFPGRPVSQEFTSNPNVLIDKPYMTIDNRVGSPFQDRIYVTWTFFGADGSAYIFEAYSNDYGESFSGPVLVSASSPLCTNTFGISNPNGPCDENQFSQPFTGPDGALYVV